LQEIRNFVTYNQKILVIKKWNNKTLDLYLFNLFFSVSQGKLCEISEECAHGTVGKIAGEKSARVRSSGRHTVSYYI